MAVLRGEAVDRPPVNFYEINGLDEDQQNPDPYNIYSDPSWSPLIQLAREESDRIVMRGIPFKVHTEDPLAALTTKTVWETEISRFEHTEIRAGSHTLTQITRLDRDVNTTWFVKHLIESLADLEAYLSLPFNPDPGEPSYASFLKAEADLGDSGIVMVDTADPLCVAAGLFDMAAYTVLATTEPALFHRLLERIAAMLLPRTARVAADLPGRLWRIYGPEYASPPYLRPRLFREFVVRYDRQMVDVIQREGGFARLHSHGNLRLILDDMAAMGISALDPLEPPPQGDMELHEIRDRVGDRVVLFGNLEASDLENLEQADFRQKIRRALREGRGGRGFVLMPSSCPYGRHLTKKALRNYEAMVEEVQNV